MAEKKSRTYTVIKVRHQMKGHHVPVCDPKWDYAGQYQHDQDVFDHEAAHEKEQNLKNIWCPKLTDFDI